MGSLLDTPVTALNGVAGKRAALLAKLGIRTWYDLITWFPRDFEDWSQALPVRDLEDGRDQALVAVCIKPLQSQTRGRLTLQSAQFGDATGKIRAVWFNQPWLAGRLQAGETYQLYGRVRRDRGQLTVQNPAFEAVDPDSPGKIRPIYPLTEGLTQGLLRSLIQPLLPKVMNSLPEPLPDWIRRDYQLCAIDYAISRIHQPTSLEEAEICRRRLVFEEFFLLQTSLFLLRRVRQTSQTAQPVRPDEQARTVIRQVEENLPFRLTDAQQAALAAIRSDLRQERPMNRLIQGDVGSGKTVVAALAMLEVSLCGCQAVLMAPTAILAAQHAQTLTSLLRASEEPVALLTGATPAQERQRILRGLSDGSLRLLVGTHAVIEEKVTFRNLVLTITDEQHRFGVNQRVRLHHSPDDASLVPHHLVMSATPIPRTLGLILYGDLDMTVIDQRPAGRQPVATYTARSRDWPRIEALIRRTVHEGHQVYIVCPMIEEQAKADLKSAVQTFNRLAKEALPDLGVGLLHGLLKADAKDQVMADFMAGRLAVLVSTTVIEVGVDNPRATLMVIENAERFGLAQLHQLRGRIGRGSAPSCCVLLSDSNDEQARERLRTLCHTSDGFVIAQKDLELRGPGDFFGTRQHGLPALRLANLYRDVELLTMAQTAAAALFARDPDLAGPEHRGLLLAIERHFGRALPAFSL
jgi:ATP-dependent DNA helicase RecG